MVQMFVLRFRMGGVLYTARDIDIVQPIIVEHDVLIEDRVVMLSQSIKAIHTVDHGP